MKRRQFVTIATGATGVLAGCSSVPNPDDTAGTSSTSARDGSVGDTATATGDELPGVTDGELREPGTLFEEHARTLRSTGFVARSTVEFEQVEGGETTASRTIEDHIEAATGGSPALYEGEWVDAPRSTAIWSTGSTALERETSAGSTDYPRVEPPRTVFGMLGLKYVVYFLWGGRYAVAGVDDGQVTLATDEFEPQSELSFDGTVTSFAAEMVVDRESRIRELSGELVVEWDDGGTGTYTAGYAVTDVGDVSVSEPEWVATAKEEVDMANDPAGETESSVTVVGTDYVKLDYRGSNTIPPDAFATIEQDGSGPAGRVGTEIEPGEMVYAYVTAGDTYETAVSESEPAETRALSAGTYTLEIVNDEFVPYVSVEFTVDEQSSLGDSRSIHERNH